LESASFNYPETYILVFAKNRKFEICVFNKSNRKNKEIPNMCSTNEKVMRRVSMNAALEREELLKVSA
jgi:hypothetical protein